MASNSAARKGTHKRNIRLNAPNTAAAPAGHLPTASAAKAPAPIKPLEFVGNALLRMHDEREELTNVIHGCIYLDREITCAEVVSLVKERWCAAHPRVRSGIVRKGGRAYLQEVPVEEMDWAYHVKSAQLPEPRDRDALHTFVGGLFADTMDVTKPMWQFHVVESMNGEGGVRSALVARVHHVMGDGTSLVWLFLSHLVDQPKVTATPRTRMASGKQKRRLDRGLLAPLRAVARQARNFAAGVANGFLIPVLPRDTNTVMKAKDALASGGARVLSAARPIPVSKLKQIKERIGGTINDVLVSLMVGAIRRYLAAHGDADAVDSTSTKFRCCFPINVRPRGADIEETFGNMFVLLSMAIPLHIEDRVERLVEVKRLCDNMKRSPETPLSAGMNKLALKVLPTAAYVKLTQDLLDKFSFMFTNVIGPSEPVTVRGRRVEDLAFWVPTPVGNIGCLLSYRGMCNFTVAAAPAVMPDTKCRLVDLFNDEMDKLYDTLVVKGTPPPTPGCGRREATDFLFLLATVAAVVLWGFWLLRLVLRFAL